MEQELELDFKFDLQHYSLIAIAIELFGHQLGKHEINSSFKQDRYIVNFFDEVNDNIKKCIKLLNIPELLELKLEEAVLYLGRNLRLWLRQVLCKLKLDFISLDKFFWKADGTIDELKTFEYWCNTGDKFTPLMADLFTYACCNTEQFRRSNCLVGKDKKLIQIYKNIVVQHKTVECETSKAKIIKTLGDYFHVSYRNQLSFFSYYRFVGAFKYVWNKLDDIEQEIYINHFTNKGLVNSGICFDSISYTSQKCFEVLIFVLDKMTADQKTEFAKEHAFIIFKAVYCVRPFKTLIVKFFNELQSYFSENDLEVFIWDRLRYKETFQCAKSKIRDVTHEAINELLLIKAWNLAPKSLKDSFVKYNSAWENVFKNSQLTTLKLSLNDNDLTDHREVILNDIAKAMKLSLVEDRNLDIVKKILSEMELTDEEKVDLKKKINVVKDFLIAGNFDFAMKILNIVCDSELEKINFKENLNCSEICSEMIGRPTFSKGLLTFERNICYSIANVRAKQTYCKAEDLIKNWERLLHWYFDSNEDLIVKFKKNATFINEDFLEKYFKGVEDRTLPPNEKWEEQLDKIFKYWMVADEQINRLTY